MVEPMTVWDHSVFWEEEGEVPPKLEASHVTSANLWQHGAEAGGLELFEVADEEPVILGYFGKAEELRIWA